MNLFNKKPSMKCPKCGFPVLPKHTFCPNCGQPLTVDAKQKVVQEQKEQKDSLREQWEKEFEIERKTQQAVSEEKRCELHDEAEQKQRLADRDAQRSREGQQFDFDLEERRKDADDIRIVNRNIHQQEMADREMQRVQDIADRETQRSREGQQFDFDLEERRKDADEARSLNRDIHQQEMTDREAQRSRDDRQFDFDLEQHKEEMNDERSFKRDEHSQAMTDRDTQRRRDQQQIDFDLRRAEKTADLEIKQQEKTFDFDIEYKRQKIAEEHVFHMEEHEIKMAAHQQNMADREAQRRMEELKLKGDVARQNMQVMMDAKRLAHQDDLKHEADMQQSRFEAEERRMQTQKEMTAEQIMAAQIREMDAGAQAKFAESFSAGKDAAREREMAKEQAAIYDKVLGVNNTQVRNVGNQVLAPLSLNTLWLRERGFKGSFNELAGYLQEVGGQIAQEQDKDGNPVIVVTGLNQDLITNILRSFGVDI